jgi:colanic acid/amylovoran biosynthesis glycosyltransferase
VSVDSRSDIGEGRSRPDPTRGTVMVYARRIRSAYADLYILRQAQVLAPFELVVAEPVTTTPSVAATPIAGSHPITRGIGRKLGRAGLSIGWDFGYSPIAALNARRLLRRHSVAAVYSMFLWNAIDVAPVLRHRGHPPLIVHVAGSDITTARRRGAQYVERTNACLRGADVVLAGSDYLAGCVHEASGVTARRHYVGIVLPELRARRTTDAECRYLAVGGLVPIKGMAETIRAFAKAFPHRSDVSLRIVGDGPEHESLVRLIERLRIGDRVRLLGHLDHTRVYTEMAAADVFVQHSTVGPDGSAEGIGGSLLEAAAHGLPVVGTRTGGVPEAVIHGQTGLLGSPGDTDEMAQNLMLLSTAPELRTQFGQAGRAFVRNHHDAAKQDAQLAAIIGEAATRAAARSSR